MPEISRFYGIIIYMNYKDHNPPHFHARYGEFKVVIKISDFAIMDGKLPPKAYGIVMEWAVAHKGELMRNWNAAKNNKQPSAIEPLK